jgi:hypothetical protein
MLLPPLALPPLALARSAISGAAFAGAAPRVLLPLPPLPLGLPLVLPKSQSTGQFPISSERVWAVLRRR